ncbi:MAG: gliding motility-associated ABC transporter substrate-binding protein GldG [Bacteroidota bacterium]
MKKIFASKFWWLFLLVFLFGINFLASVFHSRFDLTKEKRYTLSKATKNLLGHLDAPVSIDVFLKGEFPAGFKKLANGVQEFLQECKEYSNGKLRFQFVDPFKNATDSAENFLKETRAQILRDSASIIRDTSGSYESQFRYAILSSHSENTDKEIVQQFTLYLMDSLRALYNISPLTLQAPGKVGDEQVEKKVLPGALIHYENTTGGVNLLQGQKSYGTSPEELAALYNDVEATLEYKFASAIQKMVTKEKPLVGYALGNGEGWGYNVNDAIQTLIHNYRFDTVNIRKIPFIPSEFNAIVILKPTIPFTDEDKFKIDQYVMRGGKLFWMIDNMYAEMDSLTKQEGFIAYDRGLNLEDILFRYGVRLNQNLLQDMQSDKLPQMSSDPNNKQTRLIDWPYFPVLNGTDHPISKNLDGVRAMFPNTLDTVKVDGIKKTFLLRSSVNARVLQAPARVDIEFFRNPPDIKQFSVRDTAVAALLEGKFKSLYTGRIPTAAADTMKAYGIPVKTVSDVDTKMIVVADGDIATNNMSQQYGPMPMGYNFYTTYTFANKDFFNNAMEYLVNPSNILETRAKDFTLRLLNPRKVKEQKGMWQMVNIVLPVMLIIIIALVYQQSRKKKYAS